MCKAHTIHPVYTIPVYQERRIIYSSVHDPCAVCSDGVGNVVDVDGVQMLVRRPLNKDLNKKFKTHHSVKTNTCFQSAIFPCTP